MPNLRINLDKKFLKDLMIKASGNTRPYADDKFIKKLGLKKTTRYVCLTIYHWLNYNKTIPLNKLSLIRKLAKTPWSKIEKNINSIKSGFKGGEIYSDFPINIDKKLGSIIGHILGDGSIDLKYKQVFYSNSNKELLKEFLEDMESIFGISPRIWMQRTATFEGDTRWEKRIENIDDLKKGRNCGLFYPTICGSFLNKIFGDFAIGKDKKISEEILSTNRKFKKGLLRAFYDDEGSVGNKNIRLFQDRKDILESFRKILKVFDISANEIKTYRKKDKDRYYFDVFRKSNLSKFYRLIGFTSSNKMKKLKEIRVIKRPSISK